MMQKYYIERLNYIKYMFFANDPELKEGKMQIKNLIVNYKELENHDNTLVSEIETILNIIK